jgi:hypothetical protein
MFKLKHSVWLLVLCSLSGSACAAPKLTDSQAKATRELPDMIAAALAEGAKSVKIPPGRYFVQPKRGTHLRLENIDGFTIDATGVEMVCTETTRAILIENCKDVTILGLTIDYDPLPYTQGQIVEISEDRKSHTIQIEEGYSAAASAIVFKHIIYTAEGDLRYGHYYGMQLEVLPGNQLRVFDLNPRKDGGEQIGDTVVISSESLVGFYNPHAVQLYNSVKTVLEDVTIYASPCFGFLEEHSSESIYRNCVVDRREGRLHSLNADAFHSKFAKVGPRLENCRAMWMGDDGINICGSYHMVIASEGNTLRVLAKRKLDIEVGDPVQLLAADGSSLPPAKVVSIRRAGERTDEDLARMEGVRVLPSVRKLLKDAYWIELDRPIDLAAGSVIGSLNRMGNGFAILNSEFGNIRSRGILVKASDGVIANNTIVNCHLQGIKISPEYLWLESGTSHQVRVEGNEIIDSKAESILIDNIGSAVIHENIDILNNRIRSNSYPLIRIRGLDGGRVQRNDLSDSRGHRAPDSAVSIKFSEKIKR